MNFSILTSILIVALSGRVTLTLALLHPEAQQEAQGAEAVSTQAMLDEYHHRIATDPDFPAFHVRPPKNWNNDPNGPMRYPSTIHQGMAHLWMQYNPDAAVWGNMSWWHTVSHDGLVHWLPIGVSLKNDLPYDKGGVFSGSATLVNSTQLGIPGAPTLVPVVTYTCVDEAMTQLQCLAYPANASDPLLKDWVKDSTNPVISTIPIDEKGSTSFRDPTTAWQGSSSFPQLGSDASSEAWSFATALGVQKNDGTQAAAIVLWTKDSMAANKGQWGRVGGAGAGSFYEDPNVPGYMYECPDVFDAKPPPPGQSTRVGQEGAADKVVVLKTSVNGLVLDYYHLGTVNGTRSAKGPQFNPLPSVVPQRYDYGDWYASKTFWDPVQSRRILWGWIREMPESPAPARGWASMQSLPRVVEYDAEHRELKITPLPELKELRSREPLASITTPQTHYTDTEIPLYVNESPECALGSGNLTACFRQEIVAHFAVSKEVVYGGGSPRSEIGINVRGGQKFIGVVTGQSGYWLPNTSQFDLGRTYSLRNTSRWEECSDLCLKDTRCNSWTHSAVGAIYEGKNCALAAFPREANFTKAPKVSGYSCGHFDTSYFQAGTYKQVWRDTAAQDPTPTTGQTVLRNRYNATHLLLSLHVFVDRSVIEAFKDDGQDRLATRFYSTANPSSSVSIVLKGITNSSSRAAVELLNATMWSMESVWPKSAP